MNTVDGVTEGTEATDGIAPGGTGPAPTARDDVTGQAGDAAAPGRASDAAAPGRVDRVTRRARFAVAAAFFVNGALFANWVARVPAVKDDIGAGPGALGLALLGLAAGSLLTMPLAGRVCERIGSDTVMVASGLAAALVLSGPALATSALTLGLALTMYGGAFGLMDVAMNVQAVAVVRRVDRPIMPWFHAAFSLGGLAGAGTGALAAEVGLTPLTHFLLAGAVVAAVVLAAGRHLLPDSATSSADGAAGTGAELDGRPGQVGRLGPADHGDELPPPAADLSSADVSSADLSPTDLASAGTSGTATPETPGTIGGEQGSRSVGRPADLSPTGLSSAGTGGTETPETSGTANREHGSRPAARSIEPRRRRRFSLGRRHGRAGGRGHDRPSGAGVPVRRPRVRRPRRERLFLAGLGAIAACAAMGEGAMADWTALFLRDVAGAGAGVAALGFAAFSITMTAGRLGGEAAIRRLGPVRVLRLGGAAATAGVVLAVVTGSTVAGLIGFSLVGVGFSCAFPLALTTAGESSDGSGGSEIAAVSVIGYLGFLVGPPLIGLLAEVVELRAAILAIAGPTLGLVALSAVVGRTPASSPVLSSADDPGDHDRRQAAEGSVPTPQPVCGGCPAT